MLDHGRALGGGGEAPVGRGRIHRRLRDLGESAVSSGERREGGGGSIYIPSSHCNPAHRRVSRIFCSAPGTVLFFFHPPALQLSSSFIS